MNLITNINENDESDNCEWLPCSCQAGWNDIDLHDTRYHSAKGFFDCTTCWPQPLRAPTMTIRPEADSVFDCSCLKARDKAGHIPSCL